MYVYMYASMCMHICMFVYMYRFMCVGGRYSRIFVKRLNQFASGVCT